MSTSEECISIPVSVLDEELFYQSFWRRKVIQILLLFFLHFLRDIWKKPKIHFVNMRWITKKHWSVELWLYFTIVIIMQGLNLTDSPQYLLPGDLLWFLNFVFITHQSVRDWLMKESTMDHYVFVSHILICIGFNCAIGISHTRAITGGSNVIDPPPPPYPFPSYTLNSVPTIFIILFLWKSPSPCVMALDAYMNQINLWSYYIIFCDEWKQKVCVVRGECQKLSLKYHKRFSCVYFVLFQLFALQTIAL